MALPAPFTLVDFAEHINRGDGFADSAYEAEMQVQAAIDHVESLCGPMTPRDVIVSGVVVRRGVWVPPVWPVLSATAIDGAGAAVTVAVDTAGIVQFPARSGPHIVTLRVGREPVPAALVLATYIIASHLWDTQRGKSARPLPSQFGQGEDMARTPMGFAVPHRAAQLMAPYVPLAIA